MEVEQIFKEHKVIPDVIQTGPKNFLAVNYKGGVAEKGIELTPTQVKDVPSITWEAEENNLYTLILTDPDAPSRKDPKFREYLHWLVINIPGNDVAKGEVKVAYVGSGPPQGSGLHRYVFLLFKQSGKIRYPEATIPKNSGSNRPKFSTAKFVKKYKLADLQAGNFFQAQWDDYVPTVHKQLSGR